MLFRSPLELLLYVGGTNPSCFGSTDGVATATVTGGVPSYNYLWSSGSTNDSIAFLGSGTYGLTVTDSIGCSTDSTIIIEYPIQITTQITKSICEGDSILITGNWINSAGTYSDTLQAISGCDSIVQTYVTLNTIPKIGRASCRERV